MATTQNFSRLLSAVSGNTLYTDTCKSVKKNVKQISDNYNEKTNNEKTNNEKTLKQTNSTITDIKYSILHNDMIPHIIICCELPGVDPKTIKMMFCSSNLLITCDKKSPFGTIFQNQDIKLIGNAKYGSIKFNITLPIIINKTKNIQFEYKDGILKITIPKTKDQDPIVLSFT